MIKAALLSAALFAAVLVPVAASAAGSPEILSVDATDAPRQVWHAKLRVPVNGAGDVALAYPKWIPGNHGPTGPIGNLGAITASVNGAAVAWTRDNNDVYTFHFPVPAGARELDIAYDLYEGGGNGGNMSAQLAVLDWNQVVLYPRNANIHDVNVKADITLPAGWTEGTALPLAAAATPFGSPSGHVGFATATLATLVDSPLYCGVHEKVVPLINANGMTSEVDLFGDTANDVEPTSAQVAHWKNLVAEADALYGYRHWEHYHYLLSLSDVISGRGLEHHASSANGLGERYLTDTDLYANGADLLSHEYTHSWNGKYRRPQGLITKNYQDPMIDDGLWVYEGMTQYWGIVLAARSGLSEPGAFQQSLAGYYASLDAEPGRHARPLIDTARAQGLTRASQSPSGRAQRRGEDYYVEGALMWLEADTLIREGTHGRKSLDDFAKLFLGNGKNTPPMVVGYSTHDVVTALNAIYPNDWATFLHTRVDLVTDHPPLAGITRGGWKLVFTPTRTDQQIRRERATRGIDASYSLGSTINTDGTVPATVETMPLARAGVAPGSKILAVNDQAFSPERLRLAIRAAQHSTAPIRLIVDDLGTISTINVNYHGGERYPRLVRDPSKPDLLSTIAAARTKGAR